MSEQDILDGLEIDAVSSEVETDPDRNAMRKKYTLQLDELSYKFKKITHPYSLLILMVWISGITFVCYILKDYAFFRNTFDALIKVLSYIATFVFSSIFTWFLENYSKQKDD